MDRLTERDTSGNALCRNSRYAHCNCECPDCDEIMTKLATYEDLGSPEQLAALIQEFASIKAVWDKSGGESLITGLETVFRELERYRQAEAEGRLVELPCKSGRGHIQQEVRDVRRVYQNIDAECTCKHCQLREGSEGNG